MSVEEKLAHLLGLLSKQKDDEKPTAIKPIEEPVKGEPVKVGNNKLTMQYNESGR